MSTAIRSFGALAIVMSGVALLLQGCGPLRHSVLAATGTNIGVEISQNPATQFPQGKLGYNRAELAFVPTNLESQPPGSAGDTAEVVMELHYPGIFSTGAASGIYQRLAVGKSAVRQPGAALLFARNISGDVSPDAAAALKAVTGIPVTVDAATKATLARAYQQADAPAKERFDEVARSAGYAGFKAFLIEAETPTDRLNLIRERLAAAGLLMQ